MTRFLLDTNIVSYLVRGDYPALDLKFNERKNHCAISTICEAETRFGLALLPREAKITAPAERFLRIIDIQPWDSDCAVQYALLAAKQKRLGKPLATMDALIAAHALAHDFILVSNDAAFRQVKGLKLEDWTKGPQRT